MPLRSFQCAFDQVVPERGAGASMGSGTKIDSGSGAADLGVGVGEDERPVKITFLIGEKFPGRERRRQDLVGDGDLAESGGGLKIPGCAGRKRDEESRLLVVRSCCSVKPSSYC